MIKLITFYLYIRPSIKNFFWWRGGCNFSNI